ncbi:murein L,D-transpeptidase catalytic domain family protein [Fusobacterium sp. MFO224]|uniref:murein L,D-transpeptidase catalytic domain family protein n=1 Tax=Fusobacterium sp. MFO224 TaxID=3378070 RepID=UPI003851C7AC
MKKIFKIILLLILSINTFSKENIDTLFLYKNYQLEGKIKYDIFKMAVNGYEKINSKENKYFTIIDYSKPSYEKRMVILNLEDKNLEYYTYVAHGKNSGAEKAIAFSNKLNSYKSSLGFYITGKPYYGSFGYSLRLKGLEENFNSNANVRNIVIHALEENEKTSIKKFGFLCRTEGCPAIPRKISREVIEKIKNGTIIFIYGEDESYLKESSYIR